jgi:hypothetical protein
MLRFYFASSLSGFLEDATDLLLLSKAASLSAFLTSTNLLLFPTKLEAAPLLLLSILFYLAILLEISLPYKEGAMRLLISNLLLIKLSNFFF